MADVHHKSIQDVLRAVFYVANTERPVAEWVTAYAEAKVGVRGNSRPASHPSASSSRAPRDSCLIADIAVGPHVSPQAQANLSPTSKKVDFPPGRPPFLVVEVTSSNRVKDLTSKVGEYARAGVPEYVVVDREKSRVIVYKLKEDKADKKGTKAQRSSRISSAVANKARTYQSQRYYSKDDIVEAVAFRDLKLTANNLLHPEKSSTRIIVSPLRKLRKKNLELSKRVQELEEKNARLEETVKQGRNGESAGAGSSQRGLESGNGQKRPRSPTRTGTKNGSGTTNGSKNNKSPDSPDKKKIAYGQ